MLLRIWLVPGLILIWLKGQDEATIQRLTVDMPALCGVPPYTGLLSNAGVVLWLCTSAVLAFAGCRLEKPRQRLGLYLPASLSLMLGMDDGLMIHESLLPAWLGLEDRIVQPGLYCLYAALLLASLRWPLRGRDHRVLLLAALGCLGASVLLDVLVESHLLSERHPLVLQLGLQMWLEDGLKLLGIVAWCGLWAREAHHRLEEASKGIAAIQEDTP